MTTPTPSAGEDRPLDLEPCPFCGGAAQTREERPELPNGLTDTLFYVECAVRECGNRTLSWYPEKAAVNAWNRRALRSKPSLEGTAGEVDLEAETKRTWDEGYETGHRVGRTGIRQVTDWFQNSEACKRLRSKPSMETPAKGRMEMLGRLADSLPSSEKANTEIDRLLRKHDSGKSKPIQSPAHPPVEPGPSALTALEVEGLACLAALKIEEKPRLKFLAEYNRMKDDPAVLEWLRQQIAIGKENRAPVPPVPDLIERAEKASGGLGGHLMQHALEAEIDALPTLPPVPAPAEAREDGKGLAGSADASPTPAASPEWVSGSVKWKGFGARVNAEGFLELFYSVNGKEQVREVGFPLAEMADWFAARISDPRDAASASVSATREPSPLPPSSSHPASPCPICPECKGYHCEGCGYPVAKGEIWCQIHKSHPAAPAAQPVLPWVGAEDLARAVREIIEMGEARRPEYPRWKTLNLKVSRGWWGAWKACAEEALAAYANAQAAPADVRGADAP